MQKYIGIKLIEATPKIKVDFYKERGLVLPAEVDPFEQGYKVIYPDGYESWSPKAVFESAYLPLKKENMISPEDFEGLRGDVETTKVDPKTTLVKATLSTGFVDYQTSSCVDPANYDENTGRIMACRKIDDRLWYALGFILQWGLNGLKSFKKAAPLSEAGALQKAG